MHVMTLIKLYTMWNWMLESGVIITGGKRRSDINATYVIRDGSINPSRSVVAARERLSGVFRVSLGAYSPRACSQVSGRSDILSTLATCPHRPHGMPLRYHVPLRRIAADLVQLEVWRIAFWNLACIHFLYLAGLDIMVVCDSVVPVAQLFWKSPTVTNCDCLQPNMTATLQAIMPCLEPPKKIQKFNSWKEKY